jgi:hypothetical protein
MEDSAMRERIDLVMILAVLLILGAPGARAQDHDDDDDEQDQSAVAKALPQAKVSLSQALQASEHEGKPISAKFEVEDGKLQLSVYTMKGDKFSEVVVDHMSGKTLKAEAITGGEDLTAAKSQGEAMAKAKKSLRAAVEEALKANKGYRAVSIFPEIEDGHPVADITLAKGEELKKVEEKLE